MRDSKRDTDVKNRLLDLVGEGEAGMIWKNSTEMFIYEYITSCYDCQLPYQSTARKDRGFINVYFGFYFPSLSFFFFLF